MINSDKKVEKVEKKYVYECCDYITFKKEHFNKHILSAKHKKLQNMIKSDKIMINSDKKVEKVENKDFMEYDDKQAFYAKTMSNIGKPVGEVEDKIIKNICKENYVKE